MQILTMLKKRNIIVKFSIELWLFYLFYSNLISSLDLVYLKPD